MSLREKLFGPNIPLREKLATLPVDAQTLKAPLSSSIPKKEDVPITSNDGMALESKGVPKMPTIKPLRRLEQTFIGTNYDPHDPDQTKPEPDGLGKALIKLDDSMVATSLKEDGITGNLRLGTVIRVPSLDNKLFLVADTMNKRFNGMNKIDFVAPNKKKEPDPTLNQNFDGIEIIREGNGAKDARKFVESGEWDKLKNTK